MKKVFFGICVAVAMLCAPVLTACGKVEHQTEIITGGGENQGGNEGEGENQGGNEGEGENQGGNENGGEEGGEGENGGEEGGENQGGNEGEEEQNATVRFMWGDGYDIPFATQEIEKGEKAVRPVYQNNEMPDGFIYYNQQKLIGFFTAGTGGEKWDFDNAVTESVTLYAQWIWKIQVQYTTEYGATNYVKEDLWQGEIPTKVADPILVGKTFVEWQIDGVAYDFETPLENSANMTAVFEDETELNEFNGKLESFWGKWKLIQIDRTSQSVLTGERDLIMSVLESADVIDGDGYVAFLGNNAFPFTIGASWWTWSEDDGSFVLKKLRSPNRGDAPKTDGFNKFTPVYSADGKYMSFTGYICNSDNTVVYTGGDYGGRYVWTWERVE